MKKCCHCKLIKSYENFHKHSTQKDGYHKTCKLCRKIEDKIRYDKFMLIEAFVKKERKRGREKQQKFKYKSKSSPKSKLNYKEKYPEKYKARIVAQYLSREKDFENHHWSYNDEHFLDVIKISKKEHKKAHRFIIYNQSIKLYLKHDTKEVLDTKQKHEEYIKKCILEEED